MLYYNHMSYFSKGEIAMPELMSPKLPYRLQIMLPDQLRRALKRAAAREDTSQQDLVVRLLADWLRTQPEGALLHIDNGEHKAS